MLVVTDTSALVALAASDTLSTRHPLGSKAGGAGRRRRLEITELE
jgi:hypothetical protein